MMYRDWLKELFKHISNTGEEGQAAVEYMFAHNTKVDFNCGIKDRPAQPSLSIRACTPIQGLPDLLGESFGRIAAYLTELDEAGRFGQLQLYT